jgi:hypothetical protein
MADGEIQTLDQIQCNAETQNKATMSLLYKALSHGETETVAGLHGAST